MNFELFKGFRRCLDDNESDQILILMRDLYKKNDEIGMKVGCFDTFGQTQYYIDSLFNISPLFEI